jgi:hypothetical protein
MDSAVREVSFVKIANHDAALSHGGMDARLNRRSFSAAM